MANLNIKKGMVLELPEVKSGGGVDGKRDWFAVTVKAKKGYDKITIWAVNAAEAKGFAGSGYKIEEIISVRLSNQQKGGKWYKNFDVYAVLSEADPLGYAELKKAIEADEEDPDLPF